MNDDKPVAFHDVRPDSFPMTIEFLSEATGKVLHTIHVDGPGVVEIPGQDFFKEPVGSRITTPQGIVRTDSQGRSWEE